MYNSQSFFLGALLSSANLIAPVAAQTPLTFKSELFSPNATNWPDNKIPYKFDTKSGEYMSLRHIRQSMLSWERKTCIRFRQVGLEVTENIVSMVSETTCGPTEGSSGAGAYNFGLEYTSCTKGNAVAMLGQLIGFEEGPESITSEIARAVNERYGCDNAFFNPPDDPNSSCSPAEVNSNDSETSVYKFVVDEETKAYAREGGYGFLAINQKCLSLSMGMSTQNFGFIPLEKEAGVVGFDLYRYELTLDRCKKGFSRAASSWALFFCTEESQDSCREDPCDGYRGICVAGGPKNVLVNDPRPLLCRGWSDE